MVSINCRKNQSEVGAVEDKSGSGGLRVTLRRRDRRVGRLSCKQKLKDQQINWSWQS